MSLTIFTKNNIVKNDMTKRTFSAKLINIPLLLPLFFILFFHVTACSNPTTWFETDNVLITTFGKSSAQGGSAYLHPMAINNRFKHKIILTSPGQKSIVLPLTEKIEVKPGIPWTITVRSYYNGRLYAAGTSEVTIGCGETEIVDIPLSFELLKYDGFFDIYDGEVSQLAKGRIGILPLIYILAGILPYTGDPIVSDDLRNSFNMENFFGERAIPERVKLLDCGRDAFVHRVNLISKAQKEILLASFSLHGGASSDIIIGALLAAAGRGVRVNIILDGKMNAMPRRYRYVLAGHDNINFYRYNTFNFFRPGNIPIVFHDKYMTIDNRFMIFGGRNMSDRYFKPDCFRGKGTLDKEVLVFNTDSGFNGSISAARELFYKTINAPLTVLYPNRRRSYADWETLKDDFIELYKQFKSGPDSLRNFDYHKNTVSVNNITLLYSPREGKKKEAVIAYNLLMMAYYSDNVLMQSPYFAMTNRFLNIIGEVSRNRNITLLTNSLASAVNLPASSRYHVSRRNILNRTNITIYEYQETETSIHGKCFIFGDRLTVITSFNLNQRSVQIDLEAALIIDSIDFNIITRESVGALISKSLRVLDRRNYAENENVAEGHVTRRKRFLYTIMGYILVIGKHII